MVAPAGAMGSFAEAAAETLPASCGLRLGESTVERVGTEVGERSAAADTFGPAKAWDRSEDSEGKTVGSVSADPTGVGMPGANGAAADGRMAAVGTVWNAGVSGQVRYACGRAGGLAASGEPLRRQAGQVGMDAADRRVAISDGGAGIEDRLRTHFPRAEAVVPDFDHAAQHASDRAKALHRDGAAEATRVAGEWCHRLKRDGGAAVLADLRAMAVGRKKAAKEAHRQLSVHGENRVHRMDYPTYRAKGWAIGSGPVEAAEELAPVTVDGR